MSCPENAPAPFACPTLEQSIDATAMLLPRGRAWPANDRSMLPRFLAWLAGLAGAIPLPAAWPPGFVQAGFIAAVGAVRNYLEARLCALRLEFWCATETETNDEWMAEFGLPDGCEPFPDLCTKVAAQGGARCEFYQEICARLGWVIICDDFTICANPALSGHALAGTSRASGARANQLNITVDLPASPSYGGGFQTPPLAGRLLAGMPNACPPDYTTVRCLMDRIAHAHVTVNYLTV
jgi:hypothetical protein